MVAEEEARIEFQSAAASDQLEVAAAREFGVLVLEFEVEAQREFPVELAAQAAQLADLGFEVRAELDRVAAAERQRRPVRAV